MATGKLAVKEFKKGKKQAHLIWTNAKGKPRDLPLLDPKQVSFELAAIVSNPARVSEVDGVEVDFEEVNGQPQKIRRKGEPWQQPAVAAPPPRPARQDPRGQQHQPQPTQRARRPPAFRNPYNFVPAPPRVPGPLGDCRPCSHERWHADRFTGTIGVRLTTVTPLLLPDAAQASETARGHKIFPVRVGPDGQPFIPPTSIKGMLRSAYEAVTNSRFGVFSGHDDRLAYRAPAQDGLAMVPAIVENGTITLQRGTTRDLPTPGRDGRWRVPGAMYAAWLPMYKNRPRALRYPDNTVPAHGDRVWCWIIRVPHKRNFEFWGVMRIARSEEALGKKPDGDGEILKIQGRVCVTNENIGNKHDERVFFEHDLPPVQVPLSDPLRRQWKELVCNYRELHREAIEQRRKEKNRGPEVCSGSKIGDTAWSRHVYADGAENLDSGPTLCYALVTKLGPRPEIAALYPVMISRKLYEKSPLELLKAAGNLTPAASIDELSPADRVFGWVAPSGGSVKSGPHAYRGNIRIGPVTCRSEDPVEKFPGDGLPLAILGQPKPQQGRFYVAASPRGDAQGDELTKEEAGYSVGKGLRGRKVYPHQRNLGQHHWKSPLEDRTQTLVDGNFQEYRKAGEPQTNQNRSIRGWVRPGSVFTFDIHVTNLTREELGGLLWLLELGSGPAAGCFRLGGGKPLGFGSVRLEIDADAAADAAACRIASGADLRARYQTLRAGAAGGFDGTPVIADFRRAVADAYTANGTGKRSDVERFDGVPFIAAFVRSIMGYDDDLPVHYPRARQGGQQGAVPPHPDGKSYEWFVANDRAGARVSLQDLSDDPGLPMLDAEADRWR